MKQPNSQSAITLASLFYVRQGREVFQPCFRTTYHLLLREGDLFFRVVVAGLSNKQPNILPLKTHSAGEAAVKDFDYLFAVNVDSLDIWILPSADIPLRQSLYLGEKYNSYRTRWSLCQQLVPTPSERERPVLFRELLVNKPAIDLSNPTPSDEVVDPSNETREFMDELFDQE